MQDTVLASRCELDVTDFVEAITQAARSAAPLGAAQEDTLAMAISRTNENTSGDRLHAAFQFSAVTVNLDGVISSCLVDVAEAESTVKDGAFTGKSGRYPSNKGKRNDLMVETDSSDGVGWFEQAGAFEKYVTGKTLRQLKATPLSGGRAAADSELAKTCSIPVAALLDNLIKSIESAETTGETATPATTTTRYESLESMLDTAESIAESAADFLADAVSDLME